MPEQDLATDAPVIEPDASRPRARGWVHRVSFLVAAPAGLVLIAVAPTTLARIAVSVYVVALITVFWVSSTYHRNAWSVEERARWQRRDHAAITC